MTEEPSALLLKHLSVRALGCIGICQGRQIFIGIERFEGTCYKTAGWIECGRTWGFGCHRIDCYRERDRPEEAVGETPQPQRHGHPHGDGRAGGL